MSILTLDVAGLDQALDSFRTTWNDQVADAGPRISFATAELLWKVLTAKRWDVLKAMTGQGPMAVRAVARRVDWDVKAVHGDIQALVASGILRRTAEGRIEFPYDGVHVNFRLQAA
jgi:predicted transcriptional regulator